MSVVFYPGSHAESPVPRDRAVERQLIECRSEFLRYFRRRLACPEDAEDALQDFSLKVHYTPVEVRAQIKAAEDAGIDQWLLWNANNRYSEDALRPAGVVRKAPSPSPSPR